MSDALLEWILARFTPRARASAILGDLIEQRTAMGSVWFWRSYAWVFICLAWRAPVAWIAAFMGATAYPALFRQFVWVWRELAPHESAAGMHLLWPTIFLYIAAFMGMAVPSAIPYLVIRFGVRDRMTQLAMVLGTLSILGLFLRPLTAVTGLFAALTVGIAFAALFSRSWCKPFVVLVLAKLIASLGAAQLFSLTMRRTMSPESALKVATAPQRELIFDFGFVLLFAIACSLLRRWLLVEHPAESETDDDNAVALRM